MLKFGIAAFVIFIAIGYNNCGSSGGGPLVVPSGDSSGSSTGQSIGSNNSGGPSGSNGGSTSLLINAVSPVGFDAQGNYGLSLTGSFNSPVTSAIVLCNDSQQVSSTITGVSSNNVNVSLAGGSNLQASMIGTSCKITLANSSTTSNSSSFIFGAATYLDGATKTKSTVYAGGTDPNTNPPSNAFAGYGFYGSGNSYSVRVVCKDASNTVKHCTSHPNSGDPQCPSQTVILYRSQSQANFDIPAGLSGSGAITCQLWVKNGSAEGPASAPFNYAQ
jgi:hypothetical protein